MKISVFPSVKAANKGEVCSAARFWELTDNPRTIETLKLIRQQVDSAQPDKDRIAALKQQLPVICWQASFEGGSRSDANAVPSGLYMLDIDHTTRDTMLEVICKAKSLREQMHFVYIGETPKYGVRIVGECLPQYSSIAECQDAAFEALGIPAEQRDTVCVDWARCSFMVPGQLIHYFDGTLFERQPAVVYEKKAATPAATHSKQAAAKTPVELKSTDSGQTDYKGIPLDQICREWLRANGGEPTEGNRNTQLFKLAVRLRYITDFNDQVMLRSLPSYGLPDDEMRQLVRNACQFTRAQECPADMRVVVERLLKQQAFSDEALDEFEFVDINDTSRVPPLPPVFKEWYDCAPADFKIPSVVIQLPILGALGSTLRAQYIDGTLHSPSFQVSLEAPQASGKSFMRRIIDVDLALMKEHDAAEREREREYTDKVAQLKLVNTKVTKKDKDSVLGERPTPLIRYCPATMSITQLMRREYNAKGLHLFAMAEEIDTVYKAFKRGFSSFSDALRCAFDNAEYGQDYASENSFSGIVQLYYNVLYSGTPRAMRRFYPDVEDGLISRVFFCTLPDQFGKPHPHWDEFTSSQRHALELGLTRLNEITLQGEEVQPPHVMQMPWLADEMNKWAARQQQLAVDLEDRTRDTFCRRSAVVGFRAGMLAWFLWGEVPQRRKSVVAFACWIANLMLKQHLSRFTIETDVKNTLPYPEAYALLGSQFCRTDVDNALSTLGMRTRSRHVIYKWISADLIERVDKEESQKSNNLFKKKVQ